MKAVCSNELRSEPGALEEKNTERRAKMSDL